MNFEKVFERATIRGIVDYLIFGIGPDEDSRSYEERLESLFKKFEEAVKKYDNNPTSELVDIVNELTSETASVYAEIGLQAGLLLIKDMVENTAADKNIPLSEHARGKDTFHANGTILEGMYKARVENAIAEVQMKDEKYRKVNDEARKKIEEIETLCLGKKEWLVIDRALSATNERCSEYGRLSYRQGFLDAVSLLKK